MGRTIVIGDVHGMLDPLVELIDVLRPTKADTLVFLGDLINKGPNSLGVVRYVRGLRDFTNVVLIRGNHEEKHKKWRKRIAEGDLKTAMSMKRSDEMKAFEQKLRQEDVDFLDSAVLFFKSENYMFVHGGVPGDVEDLPESAENIESLPESARKSIERFTITRFIDRKTGKMLPSGKEKGGDPFWAETYDGRFGRVVFGHQPWKNGPAIFPHAVGIDTGAVHGFGLTTLVIKGGDEKLITLPTVKFAEFYGED